MGSLKASAVYTPTRGAVLITGGSAGIGAAFAERFASEGRDVVLVARSVSKLLDQCEALEARYRVSVSYVAMDLAVPDAGFKLVEVLEARGLLDGITTLINNAGFGSLAAFNSIPIEREVSMVRLNVETLVALTGLFLPRFLEAGGGEIVNVSSVLGSLPMPNFAVYAATKAFVNSFTEAVASEISDQPVRLVALCPGTTATNFQGAAGFQGEVPEVFVQSPEEVVAACWEGLVEGKVVITPGLHNKISRVGATLLPNALLGRVTRALRLPSKDTLASKVALAEELDPE